MIQEEGRGYGCVNDDDKVKEIENLVLNNDERYQYGEKIARKYMVSYTLLNGKDCDITF